MPSRQAAVESNPRNNTSIVFVAVTVSACLIILFAILYFLYHLWYSLVHRSRTSPFDASTALNKLQRFSYRELRNATNSFSASNTIGKGGSGTVFRGILKDGKLVAVKLLDSASIQCEQEFQNELKILGGLRKSCPLVVSLLGYCVDKGKRLVVYEYMPNKSLQESLFSELNNNNTTSLCLNWDRRFNIILDVAKALAFLHLECEPPVIHGDVKPSNVLLESEFRAKLSDFGLSRLKLEGEFGLDLFSQDLWKSQELSGNLVANVGAENETPVTGGTPVESHVDHDEVDFALALQASSSSKNSCKTYQNVKGLSLSSLNFNFNIGNEDMKGKEVSTNENGCVNVDLDKFVNNDDELSTKDHSKELDLNAGFVGEGCNDSDAGGKQWGKDWWWRQDGSGELCSKDYVMEWIGSQICASMDTDWNGDKKFSSPEKTNLDQSNRLGKFEEEANGSPLQESRFEFVENKVEKEEPKKWKVRTKKHRKMQEWWKEEHLDEISRKTNKKVAVKSKKFFKLPHFGLGKRFHFRRRRNLSHENHNVNDPNPEFSFRKGCKKKHSRSAGSDMWSGDLFSRELSSTTSMRGTLCYVAPEYGGCGYLMEKGDIYSFGVLILVIISGRRPLHVLSSPMKLEKANLISWCRHLAHAGNTLELVDEKLKDDYNKDQASLCIHLALACLQRMPELRPDIGDVVKILKGEMELPPLPFEFSPSPPSKSFGRSRRKPKSFAD